MYIRCSKVSIFCRQNNTEQHIISKSCQKFKNSTLVAFFSCLRCCESLRTMDEISKVLFWEFSASLPVIAKLHQRELFHILPCLLTFRVKLKNSFPKICRPSDGRQSTNSSPTLGRQNRDYFRKYELARLSQIGENFISDQQLSDSLMTIDRCCCITLQIPSTLQ